MKAPVLNVYHWRISPRKSRISLRQGTVVATSEPEALAYLMQSLCGEELELYRNNYLVIKSIYSYKEEQL